MKYLLIVVLVICGISTTEAARMTYEGWCPNGSPSDKWVATVTFDANGIPVSAVGIDCNGNAWEKTYEQGTTGGFPGGQTHPASIDYVSTDVISVTSSEAVDLQLMDIQTGQTIGQVTVITGNGGTAVIDISTLGTGVYGVIVAQNGNNIDLLTFAKP